ncbi:MAG: enoyl-CoA hydratase/isomerase family protein [Alphaproteobacteria bacterium]
MNPRTLFSNSVRLEYEGQIARLVIMREEMNNAIDQDTRMALMEALDAIEDTADFKVLVIEGEGEDTFSVGLDVGELATLTAPEVRDLAERARQLHERIANFRLPTVAAIRGACTGAGLELALHCDIRFARDDARFGLPGVNIGLVSGGGSLARLAALIGAGPARALAMTGGIISAERAFMLGLITNVLGDDDFDEGITGLAQHISGLSSAAVQSSKQLLNEAMNTPSTEMGLRGVEAFVDCFEAGDAQEQLARVYGGPLPDVTVH